MSNKNCSLKNPLHASRQRGSLCPDQFVLREDEKDEIIETSLVYTSQVLMESLVKLAKNLGSEDRLKATKLEVTVTARDGGIPQLVIEGPETPLVAYLYKLKGFPVERLYWLVEKATNQVRQERHYNIWRSDNDSEKDKF